MFFELAARRCRGGPILFLVLLVISGITASSSQAFAESSSLESVPVEKQEQFIASPLLQQGPLLQEEDIPEEEAGNPNETPLPQDTWANIASLLPHPEPGPDYAAFWNGIPSPSSSVPENSPRPPSFSFHIMAPLAEGLRLQDPLSQQSAIHVSIEMRGHIDLESASSSSTTDSASSFSSFFNPFDGLDSEMFGDTVKFNQTMEEGKGFIYAFQPVEIRTSRKINVILELADGEGGWEMQQMGPDTPLALTTNTYGRVSFSIPISCLSKGHLPALWIHLPKHMLPGEWEVAHVDTDVIHRLSVIRSEHLIAANPAVSPAVASRAVRAIRFLAHGALKSNQANIQAMQNDDQIQSPLRKRFYAQSRQERDPPSYYDPSSGDYDHRRHQVSSFYSKGGHPSVTIFDRRLLLDTDGVNTAFPSASVKSLYKRGFNGNNTLDPESPIHIDVHSRWSVFRNRTGIIVQYGENFVSKVVETVEHVLEAIAHIFRAMKIQLFYIWEAIKELFDYDDILRTQRFLSGYYRSLLPLGDRGLGIIKRKYRTIAHSMTNYSSFLFKDAIESAGAEDINLSNDHLFTRGPAYAEAITMNHTVYPIPKDLRHGHNGLSRFIEDRILNNVVFLYLSPVLESGQRIVGALVAEMHEVVVSLISIFTRDTFLEAAPHILKFTEDKELFGRGPHRSQRFYAECLNMVRSLITLSVEVFGKVIDAILPAMTVFWKVSQTIMFTPIKIPVVYELYTTRMTRGQSELTLLDMITLVGGWYATVSYKLWNNNEAPFTDIDLDVLGSIRSPELLVYTWNNDPRTSSANNPALKRHRLGLYDWIPRAHMGLINTIVNLINNAVMYYTGGNPKRPGDSSTSAQALVPVIQMMSRLAQYPMTQLKTNDPKAIQHSIDNPDSRYLGWWTCSIVEDVINWARPRFPKIWREHTRLAMTNLVVSFIPNLIFGVRLNIDTALGVKRGDWRRQGAVALSWVSMAFNWFNYFVPFLPISGEELLRLKMTRDLMKMAVNHVQVHWMMGLHIVGMLSSSYQGPETTLSGNNETATVLPDEHSVTPSPVLSPESAKPTSR